MSEHTKDDLEAAEKCAIEAGIDPVFARGATRKAVQIFLAGITHARSRPEPSETNEMFQKWSKQNDTIRDLRMEIAELKERMSLTDLEQALVSEAREYVVENGMENKMNLLSIIDRITSSRGTE